jgi:hypothetical protein
MILTLGVGGVGMELCPYPHHGRMNDCQMVPFNLILPGVAFIPAVEKYHFRSIGIGCPVDWLSRQM